MSSVFLFSDRILGTPTGKLLLRERVAAQIIDHRVAFGRSRDEAPTIGNKIWNSRHYRQANFHNRRKFLIRRDGNFAPMGIHYRLKKC